MNSQQLAAKVSGVCLNALDRITGVGHEQYARGLVNDPSNQKQRHEDETLEDHLRGLEEELLDTINWAAMAVLKLREAREKADRYFESIRDSAQE